MNEAAALDAADALAHCRGAFDLPEGVIYLDGNSLGPLPKAAATAVEDVVHRQWGQDLIASWNRHGWIDLPVTVGEKIAPLIGAGPGQVLCVDSISVNLFKLLAAALALQPGRRVVLTVEGDFPTDGYIVQGLSQFLGTGRCVQRAVPRVELESALDDEVAVLLLTEVNYRSGERLPMAALTERAHRAGALVVWDLAHSAGALPVDLDGCDVDFAVGCGYKYLNGGPGAPAFVYCNRRLHASLRQPLSGWLGHADPFAFTGDYRPADGVLRFQAGTPPIVSMAALDAALDVFSGVSLHALMEKSHALGDLFLRELRAPQKADGGSAEEALECVTPLSPTARGCQLSFRHPHAWGISQALIEEKVIVDFRAPDIVRLGFAPLYTRFGDAARAAEVMRAVLAEARYLEPRFQRRPRVT